VVEPRPPQPLSPHARGTSNPVEGKHTVSSAIHINTADGDATPARSGAHFRPHAEPALTLVDNPRIDIDRHSGDIIDPTAHDAIRRTPVRHSRPYVIAKRAFDIAFASTLIILLAPVWLIAAGLVRATSDGPVLHRQARVGAHGRAFRCLKFRTMVRDAHHLKMELVAFNEASGPIFKIRRDPRLTPVGRWLRKFSIDELPQLINVLRGDMSIVGPRPPLPDEVAHYTDRQLGRLAVQPGLTCLWQVSGRSEIGFDEWVELDLHYLQRRSFWYDTWLILRTIPAVLTARGAF
jgi:lipopolysaccharide/colanic/teichoic acid biosynthesis glycosyltransferase